MKEFTGFSRKTFQFFRNLEQNNTKEWFDANRKIYESEVKNKMKEFCLALVPSMIAIDPEFEVNPSRCISRINRDTRFSKDKSPYKTHVWMTFMYPVKTQEWKSYPGFFIEISADSYLLGMGMYQPAKKVMDDVRDHIAYVSKEFETETKKILAKEFLIGGEGYKKVIKNDLPEYFQQWYNKKGLYVYKNVSLREKAYTADFVEEITSEFKTLEWFYNFLKQSQPE